LVYLGLILAFPNQLGLLSANRHQLGFILFGFTEHTFLGEHKYPFLIAVVPNFLPFMKGRKMAFSTP